MRLGKRWARTRRRLLDALATAVTKPWTAAVGAGLPVIFPYAPGARWLSRACARRPVQRALVALAAARFRAHPGWTGAPLPAPRDLERFLATFYWRHWRMHALDAAPADVFARSVSVEAWEHWEKARASGRGVIFVSGHLGLDALLPVLLTRLGVPVLCLQTASDARPVRFRHLDPHVDGAAGTRALLEASRELARGGAVLIRADGGRGQDVQVPFLGATQGLPPTLALLARSSGAIALPVLASPEAGGRIALRLFPPLPDPDPARARPAQITALTAHFAAWLEARWREDPALIGRHYWRLRRHGTWDRNAGRERDAEP